MRCLAAPLRHELSRSLLGAPLQRLTEQRDARGAEQACVAIVTELVMATRAECLFFDSQSGVLWSEARDGERHAFAGLVADAARTGTRVNVPAVEADPRWVEALDGGQSGERLLAVPVVGQSQQVHAVLVGWRAGAYSPFSAEDETRLAGFAEGAAPFFDQLSLELEALERARGQGDRWLFRAEALERRLPRHYGALLRVPRASIWPYVALAGLLGCVGGLFWVGRTELNPMPTEAEAGAGRTAAWFVNVSDYVCELTGRVLRSERRWHE